MDDYRIPREVLDKAEEVTLGEDEEVICDACGEVQTLPLDGVCINCGCLLPITSRRPDFMDMETELTSLDDD